jgi:hypothetical protein
MATARAARKQSVSFVKSCRNLDFSYSGTVFLVRCEFDLRRKDHPA